MSFCSRLSGHRTQCAHSISWFQYRRQVASVHMHNRIAICEPHNVPKIDNMNHWVVENGKGCEFVNAICGDDCPHSLSTIRMSYC